MDRINYPPDIQGVVNQFENFKRLIKGQKRFKYPMDLIDSATELLARHPSSLIKNALQISESTMARLQKLAKQNRPEQPRKGKVDFIELKPIEPEPVKTSIEIVLANSRSVRFQSGTSLNYLSELIAMLNGVKNA